MCVWEEEKREKYFVMQERFNVMRDNLDTDEEITADYRRIMRIVWTERICNEEVLRKGQKKNLYAQNLEDTDEIPWRHNEKRWLGKLNPHKAH